MYFEIINDRRKWFNRKMREQVKELSRVVTDVTNGSNTSSSLESNSTKAKRQRRNNLSSDSSSSVPSNMYKINNFLKYLL